MTQEQIEKIAQEYVDKNYNGDLDFPSYDAIVNVISFVCENYRLISYDELCSLTKDEIVEYLTKKKR